MDQNTNQSQQSVNTQPAPTPPQETNQQQPITPQPNTANASKKIMLVIAGLIFLLLLGIFLYNSMGQNTKAPTTSVQPTAIPSPTNVVEEDELQKEINEVEVPEVTGDMEQVEKDINAL